LSNPSEKEVLFFPFFQGVKTTTPISSLKLTPKNVESITSSPSSVFLSNPPNAPPSLHLSPILDGSDDREVQFLPFFPSENLTPAPVLLPALTLATVKPNRRPISTTSRPSTLTTARKFTTTVTPTTTSATTTTLTIPEEVTDLSLNLPSFEIAENPKVPEIPSDVTKSPRLVLT
jgi:hypothetical protein